ncbi:5-dehydro-2-deoxygluconokinase [Melghirimyces algeriensis]|uniref:5-dehydro-2-deoxygluconokinase n=1 Tax=Melghirimyces algeriensis TaxID=910412 RepID=A0A521B422_9BACL|nr:5-dehydro-2-deoxygluconokinase [Melghirimyces algeriensis]SMO41806.1 5-dehydro-2-deoxygluconokinase [Melghirimyces algeriensis]
MGAEVYSLGRVIVDLYANDIHTPLRKVRSFNKYLGGSAGNTAVGLARLGAKAGLISRVGNDEFGAFLTERLKEEKVDTSMVKTDPCYPTGLAFAALFPPSDSDVLFYRKPCADAHISLEDIDFDALKEAKVLTVSCTVLSQSPGREATLAALEANRASGGLNVLDLDWRPMFWGGEEEARVYYRIAIRMADVILANEPELVFAGESNDPDEASKHLLSLGVREVVAKRGGNGVLFYGEEAFRVPVVPVEVLNTLGAGDGFAAAYTYGLLQGWPARKRTEFAAAAGGIVVSRHSCSEAMPSRSEVEELIASQRA